MRVAILAPAPVPQVWGGTERAVEGLRRAIEQRADHVAEVVKLPVDESNLPALIDAYSRFADLDLTAFDRVISVKYPAWMVAHPHHTVYLFHPLRGLYDTYDRFRLPLHPNPEDGMVAELLHFVAEHRSRSALEEFFDRFSATVAHLGADAPDLAFPGPVARVLVHWLDAIALDPHVVEAHFALSRTVATRPGYFPQGVVPRILPLPGDLPVEGPPTEPGHHLFTASRLDEPKRHRLLIEAMAHVPQDVPLLIAGSGPLASSLQSLAAADDRIEFLGFVPDGRLVELYRDAIAVPFVPLDEDLGLISVEAGAQGAPTITCTDSGGPTEFVRDGVNGLIADPNPADLGRALSRVTADPDWARRLGSAARKKASGITWSHLVDQLLPLPARGATARRPLLGRVVAATAPVRTRRRKVVVLATYGISQPRHGGELRTRHLCRALAREVDVHLVALAASAPTVGTTEVEPGVTETVVPRSRRQAEFEDDLGGQARMPVTDILAGYGAHHTPAFLDALRRAAADAELAILIQPFLHPALEQAGLDIPFVHDAQNAEWDLKFSTLPDSPVREPLLELTRWVESAAISEARLTTTCSASDAERLATLYERPASDFHVIPNGTTFPDQIPDREARTAAEQRWLQRFHWGWGAPATQHLAVFFGSWHPPNLDAAELLIELAPEIPELLILSCGNHGLAFASRALPTNLVFPGTVSDSSKRALLGSASLALNPMRTGSGTNLKLVEFLAHGVPTISTPFGARGLPLEDGQHLLLAAPEQFKAAVLTALGDQDAAFARVPRARELAARYSWPVIGEAYRAIVVGSITDGSVASDGQRAGTTGTAPSRHAVLVAE